MASSTDDGAAGGRARRFKVDPSLRSGKAWLDGMAHDLKQPIAKLQAYFGSEVRDEDQFQSAAAAFREAHYGLNELFAFSQAGLADEIDGVTVDLAKLMNVVAESALPSTMIDAFRITVEPTDVWVFAPEAWLYRILTNLVSNAIRHSHGSHIVLRAQRTNRYIQIDVDDDGRGLPYDVQLLINQANYGSTSSGASQIEKVRGVGITTALRLANSMGAQLYPISAIRKGTSWRLELPLELAVNSVTATVQSDALAGKVVMVLDDQRDIALSVARRFAAVGAEAHAHDDETDLLIHVTHLGRPVDFYVLDFMLSGATANQIVSDLAAREDPFRGVILTGKPREIRLLELQPRLPVFSKPLRDEDFATMCELIRGAAA